MSVVRLAKLKTCRICGGQYRPQNTLQIVCSPVCARTWGERSAARKVAREMKAERAARREKKRELMSTRDWLKVAQSAVNAWVRERDHDKPCISCDATEHQTSYHKVSGWVASHYRSVGACPELRFEPLNIHRACIRCNSHLSGNIIEYRIRLRERIGDEALEWIEGPHPAKHYTAAELEAIAKDYRARTRELKKARGA